MPVLFIFMMFVSLFSIQTFGAEGVEMSDDMKKGHVLKADSANRLRGSELSTEVNGKPLHAYISKPEGSGPAPNIIMIHEWWGLNKNIKEAADKLAKQGYFVIAVDLFKGKVADNQEDAARLMGEIKAEEAIESLKTAYDWLKKNPETKSGKVGSIGWCFGGGYSLQAGLALPQVDAVVIYYGLLETDPAKLSKLKGPVLGIFANQDGWINPKMVNDFENGLKQAKIVHSINRYDADHAFANPSNPKYDQKAEADAWGKTLAFFKQHLK